MKNHNYQIKLRWTGNAGKGTLSYDQYKRDHVISIPGKPDLPASSDPSFRGDPKRYNPEELLVASLSSCHMLWYLHLCSVNGIVVLEYQDEAEGTMMENKDGSGTFKEVILKPHIVVSASSSIIKAKALHMEANKKCFIANSVNFKVKHEPEIVIENPNS